MSTPTKQLIELGIVKCKFQHTDICFLSPSEIDTIANFLAVEFYLTGQEHLGECSDEMETESAIRVKSKAKKLFTLTAKNDWLAQFLH
jgi:hypothetical protein